MSRTNLTKREIHNPNDLKAKLDEHDSALDAQIALQKREATILYSDLTDAVSGQAQAINVDDPLPANAVVIGHEVTLTTQFTGGSVSACTVKVGGSTADAIVAGFNIKTSATGKYAPGYTHETGSHGAHMQGRFGGEQLVATFTPTGDSLSHLTAGELTVTVWFAELA